MQPPVMLAQLMQALLLSLEDQECQSGAGPSHSASEGDGAALGLSAAVNTQYHKAIDPQVVAAAAAGLESALTAGLEAQAQAHREAGNVHGSSSAPSSAAVASGRAVSAERSLLLTAGEGHNADTVPANGAPISVSGQVEFE